MHNILQLRKGTTAQNTKFTGLQGELVYDTELKQLRIHDGTTVGGTVVNPTAATMSQTTQTISTTSSTPQSFTLGTFAAVQVYLNGVLCTEGASEQYTVSGSTVTFNDVLPVGMEVKFVTYSAVTVGAVPGIATSTTVGSVKPGDGMSVDSYGALTTDLAARATADASGNVISSTYQGKSTAVTHTASTAAGSATQPVYIAANGTATATTYALNKTVPSDAVFTDTVYTHPTTAGYKHIPSGGSSGQSLIWSSAGTAAWGTPAASTPTYVGTSTANGSIRVDADSGVVGVVYGGKLYASVGVGTSNLSSFTINGVTWTVPSTSAFASVCTASGLGRTIGQTLGAFACCSGVNCSDGDVDLFDGSTNTYTGDSYGVVAYRTL